MMNHYSRIVVTVFLCMSMTSLSCTRPGQRLLTVQIESNGTVVYEGIRGVPDNTPVTEMWNVLGDVPFESRVHDESPVEDEQNVRKLQGAIVVRIKHVNQQLGRTSVEDLTLHSIDSGASWSIDSAEIQRIKEAVGE